MNSLQGYNLIELPIDDSLAYLTGKITEIKIEYNLEETFWEQYGHIVSVDEESVLCDSPYGCRNKWKTDSSYSQTLEQDPCRDIGFIVPPSYSVGSIETEYEERCGYPPDEGDGNLCNKEAFDDYPLISSVTGQSTPSIQFEFGKTGYARQPYFHDYIWSVNRPKGEGISVQLKFGQQTFDASYRDIIESEECFYCSYIAYKSELKSLSIDMRKQNQQ